MAKQSRQSNGHNYAINDRIGEASMPVEGTEAPRSFGYGTGKRKYDKNDPSVAEMRKRRARSYSKPSIGMPWGSLSVSSKTSVRIKKRKTKPKKIKFIKKPTAHTSNGVKILPGGAKVMFVKRKSGIMRGFK